MRIGDACHINEKKISMILLLSPAKSLDFESPLPTGQATLPVFLDQSQLLVERLRKFSPAELAALMNISDPLAATNAARYAEWKQPFAGGKARQAALAFNGDVYEGLDARSLSEKDLRFAQAHVRILSGLYGVLRPLDLILPYRLEMGIRLENPRGKDLYTFWGERISDAVITALREAKSSAVVNLASVEYFKSVRTEKLAVPVIHPVFEDWSSGRYKVVSFYAKRARGLMARYAITQHITEPSKLQAFSEEGYAFDEKSSDEKRWVFRRKQK